MGPKQSSPAANGRLRAYSGSDVHSSTSPGGSGRTAVLRYYAGGPGNPQSGQRGRYAADSRPNALIQSAIIPNTSGTRRHSDVTDEARGQPGPRLLIGSLPAHLSPHLLGAGFHCPVCSKFVGSDEMELHLVMCLTKPRLTYNEDVLGRDAEECAICLDQMVQGDTIARLPCLCIYHKGCIDEWFEVNRSCPEHPSD
ncbi:E3 ubiquitin-protein ligase znrf2-like [Brachyhypopomus gauderio]|uniref:E3 ubiquitin-protein ligase znrf2-like n=1 Tax=Brachyhypopomus gauderio TaxID=698409 RepID=UPI00404304BC